MLEVDKLITFRAVVRHGSFSAAAKSLNLTQPAVSRQVSLLERRLGAQLVIRTHRGIRTTEAGELLLGHADAVIDRVSLAEWEVAQLVGRRHDVVRLGSFFSALVALSSELAALFEEQQPGLTIEDDLVNRDEALAKLVRGTLDVAIVFEYVEEPAQPVNGVDIVPLFDDPLRVLLPAQHPLATRDEVDLTDLTAETWIRPHAGSAARLVDRLLSHLDDGRPMLRPAGNGDEPVEVQALVASGAGIAFAHRLNVVLEPDQVSPLPVRGHLEGRRVQAVVRHGNRSAVAAATLAALETVAHRRRGET
jgi:DNA-binding transcriptional LysR family regulator